MLCQASSKCPAMVFVSKVCSLGGQLAGQANANERQPETVARFARAGLRSTWPWQSLSTRRRKRAWTTNNADELLCLCRAVYSSRWDERCATTVHTRLTACRIWKAGCRVASAADLRELFGFSQPQLQLHIRISLSTPPHSLQIIKWLPLGLLSSAPTAETFWTAVLANRMSC